MSQIPGVYIECAKNPILYSQRQVDFACRVAYMLDRGKLFLAEVPEGWSPPEDDE